MLEEREIAYRVINFESDDERILQEVKDAYDWSTVPIVFLVTEHDMRLI